MILDLLIVLAFVVYAIWAGLSSRKAASQNLQEYFLAGKTIPGWKAGCSMAATQFSADTPLLVTGLVATAGIFALWRLWIYGLAFLLMAFVFAVGWRRGGILTDAELTEVRYSGRAVLLLRVLKAIYYGTVINCVVLAMVMVAALFEVVMDLLLYLARCARLEKVRIVLGRQNGYHMVQLEPEREINFATPSNDTSGKCSSDYDVLAHIRERLYQIEGHLTVEPDCRHARRIILTSTIETV